jgi:hypothetical protein
MFNLLGSLFFGQRATDDMETSATYGNSSTPENAIADTQVVVEASTQTSMHANYQTEMHHHHIPSDTSIIKHTPFIGPLNYNESLPRHNSLDWVIVDRSEEADKCSFNNKQQQETKDTGINTSILMPNEVENSYTDKTTTTSTHMQDEEEEVEVKQPPQLTMFERSDDDNDIILGSFFEKNEHESEQDKSRYYQHQDESDQEEDQTKNWQITPLPCLTSKSVIAQTLEDPLENLLIEHPSMSVFVSATSLVSKVATVGVVVVEEDDDETDMLSMLFSNVNEQIAVKPTIAKTVKKATSKQVTIVTVSHELVTKKPAEKRKESESHHHMISVVNNFNSSSPPSPTITPLIKRKKGKKSARKQQQSVGGADSLVAQSPIGLLQNNNNNNKENIQIKSFLLNELKHKNSSSMSKSRSVDGLLNKNQMKRANRNNTFSSKQSLSQKQRKYHQLQQPAGGFSSTNMQF